MPDFINRWVTNALSDYIKPECFDKHGLSLGFLNGTVQLCNLCLKESILDVLGLPVTLRYGRIGRLEIAVSWGQLLGRPVIVKVEDVHMLVHAKFEWDTEGNEQRLATLKRSRLAATEQASENGWDLARPEPGPTPFGHASSFSNHWLFNRLLNKVLDLVQIEVHSVHLRFEDMVSTPSLRYCFGMALKSFTVGAADRARPGWATQRPADTPQGHQAPQGPFDVLKVARLEDVCLYCNPLDNDTLVNMPISELKEERIMTMLDNVMPRASSSTKRESGDENSAVKAVEGLVDRAAEEKSVSTHRFLVHPLDCCIQIFLGSQAAQVENAVEKGRKLVTRQVTVAADLDNVRVTLEDLTLRALLGFAAGLVRFENMERLGLKRPGSEVKGHAKEWWIYAGRIVLMKVREHKGKYDWEAVLRRRRQRLQYLRLWKAVKRKHRALGETDEIIAGQGEAEELRELEKETPNGDVLAYRRLAEEQLREEGLRLERTRVGGLDEQQWTELSRKAGLEREEVGEAYAGFVLRAELCMRHGSVSLAQGIQTRVDGRTLSGRNSFLRAFCPKLSVTANANNEIGLRCAEVIVEDLRLDARGQEDAEEERWSRVVGSRQHPSGSASAAANPVLRLTVEALPQTELYSFDVHLLVGEIEAIVRPSAPWLKTAMNVLNLPDMADNWKDLETIALSRLQSAREQLNAKLEFIMRTQPEVRVWAIINGPLLVVLPPVSEDSVPELHFEVESVDIRTVEAREMKGWEKKEDELMQDAVAQEGGQQDSMEGLIPMPTLQDRGRSLSWGRCEMQRFYSNTQVRVTHACVRLLDKCRDTRAVIVDVASIVLTSGVSKLPQDTQIPRLLLEIQVGEAQLRSSTAIMRRMCRLTLLVVESTRAVNRDMEQLRRKFDQLVRERAEPTSVHSFLKSTSHNSRTSLSQVVSPVGSLPTSPFLKRDHNLSVNQLHYIIVSPFLGPSSRNPSHVNHISIASGSSILAAASQRDVGSSAMPSAAFPSQDDHGGWNGMYDAAGQMDGETYQDESPESKLSDTADSLLDDEEAFRDAFAQESDLAEEEQKGEQNDDGEEDESSKGGPKGWDAVLMPALARTKGPQYREMRLLRISLCMPHLKLGLWADQPDEDDFVDCAEAGEEATELEFDTAEALLVASISGLSLGYTADSFKHKIRLRVGEVAASFPAAPASLPLLRLENQLSFCTGTENACSAEEGQEQEHRLCASSPSLQRSDSNASACRKGIAAPRLAWAKTETEQRSSLEVLLLMEMDYDSRMSGRPFKRLQLSIQLATVTLHLDQCYLCQALQAAEPILELQDLLTDCGTAEAQGHDEAYCPAPAQSHNIASSVEETRGSVPSGAPESHAESAQIRVNFRLKNAKAALVSEHALHLLGSVACVGLSMRSEVSSLFGPLLTSSVWIQDAGLRFIDETTVGSHELLGRIRASTREASAVPHSALLEISGCVSAALVFPNLATKSATAFEPPQGSFRPLRIEITVVTNDVQVTLPFRSLLQLALTVLEGPAFSQCLRTQERFLRGPAPPAYEVQRKTQRAPTEVKAEDSAGASSGALPQRVALKACILLQHSSLRLPIEVQLEGDQEMLMLDVDLVEMSCDLPADHSRRAGRAELNVREVRFEHSQAEVQQSIFKSHGAHVAASVEVPTLQPSHTEIALDTVQGVLERDNLACLLTAAEYGASLLKEEFQAFAASKPVAVLTDFMSKSPSSNCQSSPQAGVRFDDQHRPKGPEPAVLPHPQSVQVVWQGLQLSVNLNESIQVAFGVVDIQVTATVEADAPVLFVMELSVGEGQISCQQGKKLVTRSRSADTDDQERMHWESVKSSFPNMQLRLPVPHVWVGLQQKGLQKMMTSISVYIHPTTSLASLEKGCVVHDIVCAVLALRALAASRVSEAQPLHFEMAASHPSGAPHLSDMTLSDASSRPPLTQQGRTGFQSRSDSPVNRPTTEDESILMTELIRTHILTVCRYLTAVRLNMHIGSQQLVLAGHLPGAQAHGEYSSTHKDALILQGSASIALNLHASCNTDISTAPSVWGKLKVQGLDWQAKLQSFDVSDCNSPPGTQHRRSTGQRDPSMVRLLGQRLLAPLQSQVDISFQLDPAKQPILAADISCTLQAIKLFTYVDMRALNDLVRYAILPLSKLCNAALTAPSSEASAIAEMGDFESCLFKSQPITAPSAKDAPQLLLPSSMLVWLKLIHVTFQANVDLLRLKLVDNIHQAMISVLTLTLSTAKSRFENIGEHVTGQAEVQIQADAYNRSFLLWQSLLEPFGCRLSVTLGNTDLNPIELHQPSTCNHSSINGTSEPTESSPPGFKLSASLVTSDPVNVNITAALLQDLTSVADAPRKLLIHRGHRQQGEPLCVEFIYNETGIRLAYRFQEGDEWQVVPPESQVPLRTSVLKTVSKEKSRLWLRLQRPGQMPYQLLEKVVIDKVGRSVHSLWDGLNRLWVICEVQNAAGLRLLRVRSTQMIENACSMPLYVAIRCKYGVVQWDCTVPAGREVPVPLHHLCMSGLTVEVAGHSEPRGRGVVVMALDHDRDEGPTLVKLEAGESPAPLYCVAQMHCVDLPAHHPALPSVYQHQSVARGIPTARLSAHLQKLSLSTPFLITNLLPVDIQIVICLAQHKNRRHFTWWHAQAATESVSDLSLAAIKLSPGQAVPWQGAPGTCSIDIRIRCDGFAWTQPVRVRGACLEDEQTKARDSLEADMREEGCPDSTLQLHLEVESQGPRQRISISVPYWIINTTSLPLQIARDLPPEDPHSEHFPTGRNGLLAGHKCQHTSHSPGPSSADLPRSSMRSCNEPPSHTTEIEGITAYAKQQLLMASFEDTSPGRVRLKIRLSDTGHWASSILLPSRKEGHILSFDVRGQVQAARVSESSWVADNLRWRLNKSQRMTVLCPLSLSQRVAAKPFHRTKIIIIAPEYVVLNLFGRSIEVVQDGYVGNPQFPCVQVKPGQQEPLYLASKSGSRPVRLRISEFGWEWSGSFALEVGKATLPLRNVYSCAKCLLRVRIERDGTSFLITLRRMSPTFVPYVIENRTSGTLWFLQSGLADPPGSCGSSKAEMLPSQTSCSYIWDEPLLARTVCLEWQFAEDGLRREALGEYCFDLEGARDIYLNPQRVRIHAVTRGSSRVLVVSELTTGHQARLAAEAEQQQSFALPLMICASMQIQRAGVSYIDNTPQELLYASAHNFQVLLKAQGSTAAVSLTMQHIQIDDQLLRSASPVFLVAASPRPSPSHVQHLKPTSDMSFDSAGGASSAHAMRLSDRTNPPDLHVAVGLDFKYKDVLFVEFIHMDLVPLRICVDGNLLAALLLTVFQMTATQGDRYPSRANCLERPHSMMSSQDVPILLDLALRYAILADGPAQVLGRSGPAVCSAQEPDSWSLSAQTETEGMETLVACMIVSPLRMEVTFTASHMLSRVARQLAGNVDGAQHLQVLGTLLDGVGNALFKLDSAYLCFNPLTLHQSGPSEIVSKASRHYTRQALLEFYNVLGTLTLFGSPRRILYNLSAGVQELVQGMARGIMEHDVMQSLRGLCYGSGGLLVQVICSLLDVTQSIAVSSLAIIAPAALLAQTERLPTSRDNLFRVLPSALTSLASEPIKGARNAGAGGLRIGIIKGLSGLVLRPTCALLQDILWLCGRVKSKVQRRMLNQDECVSRARPARIFNGPPTLSEAYSEAENTAFEMLREVGGQTYNMDALKWHFVNLSTCEGWLLTLRHLMHVQSSQPAKYTMMWCIPTNGLQQLRVASRTIWVKSLVSGVDKNQPGRVRHSEAATAQGGDDKSAEHFGTVVQEHTFELPDAQVVDTLLRALRQLVPTLHIIETS